MSTLNVTSIKNPSAGSAAITLDTSGNAAAPSLVPPGTVQFYAASTAPSGWLKANGANISRSTYAALFTAISTTYGVGDGSTTFGLPDLRGEFPRGWDDSRGIDSGRAIGTAQNASRINSTAASNYIADNLENSASSSETRYSYSGAFGGSKDLGQVRPRNIALLAIIKF